MIQPVTKQVIVAVGLGVVPIAEHHLRAEDARAHIPHDRVGFFLSGKVYLSNLDATRMHRVLAPHNFILPAPRKHRPSFGLLFHCD